MSASTAEQIFAKPAWHSSAAIHNPSPLGYTPEQIRDAYGFDDIAFNNGSVVGDGSGQTIAIVVAHSNPNVEEDLQVFSNTFGLPDADLKRVSQTRNGQLPSIDPGWALETSLDVQWAHAIAPKAKILLVEAYSASFDDMFAAVDYARRQPGVSVVSMSWGAYEFSGQSYFDRYFTTPAGQTGITFVAASGDSGGITNYPSASPNVVSVGGTSLRLDDSGARTAELAWYGSDGGISRYARKPSYQTSINPYGSFRTTPDVAYNASMVYGVSVYSSIPMNGQTGWFELGGTSAGAPQWAGLFAIVNQGRALAGQLPLDGRTQTLPALYNLPNSAFLDVSQGVSGLFNHRAVAGYDLITGRGSPYAQFVVQGLMTANANGGVLQSVGPLQQTVVKPKPAGEGVGENTVTRAVRNDSLAFIQAFLSSQRRDPDTVEIVIQKLAPRPSTPGTPIVVFEVTTTRANPRFYRATQGYKTASGEEAPYWMEQAEDTAPAQEAPVPVHEVVPPTPEPMLPPIPPPNTDGKPEAPPIQVIIPEAATRGSETHSTLYSATSLAALTVVFSGYGSGTYFQSKSRKWFKGVSWIRLPSWK